MTIEIQITNKDSTRSAQVVEVEYSKGVNQQVESAPRVIQPGGSATFYVHLLRDLQVSEVKP